MGIHGQKKENITNRNYRSCDVYTTKRLEREGGLKGNFRASDARWTQDVFKIKGYLFDPHFPILYKLNQKMKEKKKVAYNREQLKVIDADEEDVPATITTETPDNGEVRIKKLLQKRVRGSRTEYLVQWYGYPVADPTWKFKSKLPKSFVSSYEENH